MTDAAWLHDIGYNERVFVAVLTWADLTCSQAGRPWTVGRRLADTLRRHPAGSIVHCATLAALPVLWGAARELELRLAVGGENL